MNKQYNDRYEDRLSAEFTAWMRTTLVHARYDYIRQQARKTPEESLDAISPDAIADPRDYFAEVEHSATDF